MSRIDPATGPAAVPGDAVLTEALRRGQAHLRSLQAPEGWWKGELETNVTMDAEDLLLRQFLGILRTDQRTAAGTLDPLPAARGRHLGDVLRRARATCRRRRGLRGAAAGRRRARGRHMRRGGASSSARQRRRRGQPRVFTRIWLALFGAVAWDKLPGDAARARSSCPPLVPLNIYDFGCWARQTIVALAVVSAHRPCARCPSTLDELRSGTIAGRGAAAVAPGPWRFDLLDRLLHAYQRAPRSAPVRRAALRRGAERGSSPARRPTARWGGIQPPWVYSIMALTCRAIPSTTRSSTAALRGSTPSPSTTRTGRRIEACQSPVWDTRWP